jgi:hypothetical protein
MEEFSKRLFYKEESTMPEENTMKDYKNHFIYMNLTCCLIEVKPINPCIGRAFPERSTELPPNQGKVFNQAETNR